jgi:hypothetical protein
MHDSCLNGFGQAGRLTEPLTCYEPPKRNVRTRSDSVGADGLRVAAHHNEAVVDNEVRIPAGSTSTTSP